MQEFDRKLLETSTEVNRIQAIEITRLLGWTLCFPALTPSETPANPSRPGIAGNCRKFRASAKSLMLPVFTHIQKMQGRRAARSGTLDFSDPPPALVGPHGPSDGRVEILSERTAPVKANQRLTVANPRPRDIGRQRLFRPLANPGEVEASCGRRIACRVTARPPIRCGSSKMEAARLTAALVVKVECDGPE
jgi:hypothetical protein